MREQTHLETNIKQLSTIGQSYNDQISQLKAILGGEPSSAQIPSDLSETFKAYNHYLNTKLSSLKTKVISIPEL